jgi:magnesium-transporting ATPase (P-type)
MDNSTLNAKTINWHSLSVDSVLEVLETNKQGLSFKEEKKRKKIYGINQINFAPANNPIKKFLLQFHNILIYLLLISALICLILGDWLDFIVIFCIVILNSTIAFLQERKAEMALSAIQGLLPLQANVIRDGKRFTISAKSLVPGDIVVLQSGDKVPADLRLFNVKSLFIQEAALTGESYAVEKTENSVLDNTTLADRSSMAYSGTLVNYGRSDGIVIAIGQKTEIGRINQLVENVTSIQTPLLKQVSSFGRWITIFILSLSVITFAIGMLVWGDTSHDMFMAVVGLAVAAIPEGLPTIMTITLAIGVTRMAKRNVIIKNLPAIETMGSVTTICTDKTGTLTCNELAIERIIMSNYIYEVTGSGYKDAREFRLNESVFPLEEHPDLQQLIRAGILCNDAEVAKENDEEKLIGNPIDKAFLALGLKSKMDCNFEKKAFPRVDFIPFESQHKIMGSLHHDHIDNGYIFIKGAPERILYNCTHELINGKVLPINKVHWEKIIEDLAKKGLRLVALAVKKTSAKHQKLTFDELGSNNTLLGIVGLSDPLRKDAVIGVELCQKAGINVKMITGDHVITAQAIAEQVGIKNFQKSITGEQLDKIDDDYLPKIVKEIDVYARTSPEHKLRLVKALQKNNQIVAMTGDGVNDTPALKQAEIGIAMGNRGTEATKEIADMVLIDDNFASIASAVEEGRTVYNNLRKVLIFVLPTNFGEALIIALSIIFDGILPMTAVQILWLNMVTAVTFGLSLAFEPSENNAMLQPPRTPSQAILSLSSIWHILFVGSLMVGSGFGVFHYEYNVAGVDLMVARCAVVNMLIAAECAYLFTCRKLYTHGWKLRDMFQNKVFLTAVIMVALFQIFFTYFPGTEHFFGVKPIDLNIWLHILVVALGIFFVVEFKKALIPDLFKTI